MDNLLPPFFRTRSDAPADPPSNATVEAGGARSLLVRWEPPPKESRNGVITGYKIRWRRSGGGNRRGEVVTTDGEKRMFAIKELENGQEYQVGEFKN